MQRFLIVIGVLCLAGGCGGDEAQAPGPRDPDHVDSSQTSPAKSDERSPKVAGGLTALL